jgi:hypothetical protein
MFLTITIDTTQTKKSKLRMNQAHSHAAKGWREGFNSKKRSVWQRLKSWKRKVGGGIYRLGDQVAMF